MQYYLSYSLSSFSQALVLWALVMLLLAPALWWRWRHQPTTYLLRHLAATSVLVLNITGIIAYTLLPLPSRNEFICPAGWGDTYPRFFLGWSFEFALRDNNSLLSALFSIYVLQMLLNVLLFVPFGLLARWRWRASFRTVLLAAFGTSLAVELTQLTGLWGYYGCAIRTFDAEDLFNNTLGAVLGWGVLATWQNRKTLPGQIRRLLGW